MQVIKSSGALEKFDHKKIYNTIRAAGGSKKLAGSATKEIKKKFKKNVSTEEILKFLLKYLNSEPGVSQRYNLKRAIMALGPSGFPFEKFFARVLEYYGYKTSVGNKLKGKRIIHEVDVVAEKDKKWMIECKYHNEHGTITKLHPALYTYARFLDLESYHFNSPWLVTNTRCSGDAINYAKGVGLRVTSWSFPNKESLQDLIHKKSVFPITILTSVKNEEVNKFYEANLIVAKDLLNISSRELSRRAKIDEKRIIKIIEEVREVCGK
ncbi:hypothetical protein GW931_03095 [archaeon]|nr:hypothetical protein [archaeon]PJC45272.1 MAG: hypothetical protein CO037_02370 [Candidatus Pacearchaeota archaeon CG_4_9_14_0_2_um_filter_30_8]